MSSWRSFSHLSNFHLPTEKTQPKTLARFIFPSPYLIHLSLLPLQINSSVLQFQIKICFIYRFLGLESDWYFSVPGSALTLMSVLVV
ncbi:hypothetical protein AAC387_Pa09g1794 [Persea americana]